MPEVSSIQVTCQPTAVADQIPVEPLSPSNFGDVSSLGQLSANRQLAISTRVHESGGGTIHERLARDFIIRDVQWDHS
jgi:hypothetical protein